MKVLINSDASVQGATSARGATAWLDREEWAAACAARLIELRPASDPVVLQAVAAEMALELAYFDPEIAAEMEHEGGMLDD